MPVLGPVNRIFGGVMGLVTGTFICFIICYVLSLGSALNIEFINEIPRIQGSEKVDYLFLEKDAKEKLEKAEQEELGQQKTIGTMLK